MQPSVLPGRAFKRIDRISRLLFHWRAHEHSLTPITGEAATFSRASAGGLVADVNGNYRSAVHSQPRIAMFDGDGDTVRDTPAFLLESARTNLVIQSDNITAANGWTVAAPTLVAAAYSAIGSLNLTRIYNLVAGANVVNRGVTLSGDGQKACSAVVQFDGAVGVSEHYLLTDVTASAQRCVVLVTWAADGSATAIGTVGTLIQFELLAPHTYRILASSEVVTAANTHICYPSNGATNVRVGGMQIEDAPVPSSLISTTTTPVTRSADALTYPMLWTPGVSKTVLAVLPRPLHVDLAGSLPHFGLWDIGDNGSPCLRAHFDGGAGRFIELVLDTSGTNVTATAAVPAGRVLTICGQATLLDGGGKVRLDVGSGYGAYSVTSDTGASSWNTPVVRVGNYGGAGSGTDLNGGVSELKIADGLYTRQQMMEML